MRNSKTNVNGAKKTFLEFFAGIGLMRLGLERAGWRAVFANDIDAAKREMYEHHFGRDDKFVPGDIHALGPAQIPPALLATASFPCNDLSLAGGREGLNGKNSSAFWGFTKLLHKLKGGKPPIVLLENVRGFLTSNRGKDFEQAMIALNDLGYAVDAVMLDAASFVPQSRVRLFVVGKLGAEPDIPAGIANHRPAKLQDFIHGHPGIRWSLKALPPLPERRNSLAEIVEDIPARSKLWWSAERAEYLLIQMSERHQTIAREMISAPRVSYGAVFRRVRNGKSMAELRTDGLAGCLRTPRGGSGRQILFVAGHGSYKVRLVTPAECAALMGAPGYKLNVRLNQALFGFGDAVCVPVIEWLARNYLDELAATSSASSSAG